MAFETKNLAGDTLLNVNLSAFSFSSSFNLVFVKTFKGHWRFIEISYSRLYTDGSQVEGRVAAAVVHKNITKAARLPNKASIFTAELCANCYITCNDSHLS